MKHPRHQTGQSSAPHGANKYPEKENGITLPLRVYCPSSPDEVAPPEEIGTRCTQRMRPTEGMSFRIAPALGLLPEGENR